MIELRRGAERGYADHGWLKTFHSFSFADYWDPRHTGFGPLRVINEDRIAPGAGFAPHRHRDMEILSYVLAGALAHRDSLGNGSVIVPGDLQRMSAGRGIEHSEYNGDPSATTHFLQIWIEPAVRGLDPSYEQRRFDADARRGRLCLIASPDGAEGSVRIHQDARVYATLLDGAERLVHRIAPGRRAYVHVARGAVLASGERLEAGDALKAVREDAVVLERGAAAEVLLFDLP
ncbi:MAG: pirin family protein [Burkholderiales bacterium]|nr:pirin family protein [Burkholderiales bacterium]